MKVLKNFMINMKTKIGLMTKSKKNKKEREKEIEDI